MAGGDEVRCVASGEWLVLATSTKSPAEWGLVAVWERGSGRLHAAPTDDRAEVAWKAGRVLLAARSGEEAYRAVIYDGLACGLAGSVTLLLNEYLLVIAQRRRVGRAWGDDAIRLGVGDIYKAVRFDVLPLRRVRAAEADASWVERRAERRLRRSLRRVLACDGFYFSPTLDLTRPLQDALPDVGSAPRYRTDFVWNHALLTHLTRVSVDDSAERSALLPLSIPLVFGFVDHCTAPCRTVDGASATLHYLLVSRRQRHRAGLRYIDRGADVHGHVANFVETESHPAALATADQHGVQAAGATAGHRRTASAGVHPSLSGVAPALRSTDRGGGFGGSERPRADPAAGVCCRGRRVQYTVHCLGLSSPVQGHALRAGAVAGGDAAGSAGGARPLRVRRRYASGVAAAGRRRPHQLHGLSGPHQCGAECHRAGGAGAAV
eukprot:ctg_3733.g438